jgi:hypothetical protein
VLKVCPCNDLVVAMFLNRIDDEVRFVIDQHAQLTEKTVGRYTYCPTWTHYPDS